MKRRQTFAALLAVGTLLVGSYGFAASHAPTALVADAWAVDSAHTAINFSINHFFTPVTGSFGEYEVDLEYDAEYPQNSSVRVRIATASVNTGNDRRDEHLRTPDFLAAGEHPYITFESTSISKSDGGLVARGPLTIRGTTKTVELPIKLLGVQLIPTEMQEMLGGAREIASFNAHLTIDRGDFGVGTGSWAATLVVGGDVEIDILVEAHRK